MVVNVGGCADETVGVLRPELFHRGPNKGKSDRAQQDSRREIVGLDLAPISTLEQYVEQPLYDLGRRIPAGGVGDSSVATCGASVLMMP